MLKTLIYTGFSLCLILQNAVFASFHAWDPLTEGHLVGLSKGFCAALESLGVRSLRSNNPGCVLPVDVLNLAETNHDNETLDVLLSYMGEEGSLQCVKVIDLYRNYLCEGAIEKFGVLTRLISNKSGTPNLRKVLFERNTFNDECEDDVSKYISIVEAILNRTEYIRRRSNGEVVEFLIKSRNGNPNPNNSWSHLLENSLHKWVSESQQGPLKALSMPETKKVLRQDSDITVVFYVEGHHLQGVEWIEKTKKNK